MQWKKTASIAVPTLRSEPYNSSSKKRILYWPAGNFLCSMLKLTYQKRTEDIVRNPYHSLMYVSKHNTKLHTYLSKLLHAI